MKTFIIILINIVVFPLFFLFRNAEHDLYKKYNDYPAKVVDTSTSIGRYGHITYCPTIRIEDSFSAVNAGDEKFYIGDTYFNPVYYNWVTGISGYAYFLIPGINEAQWMITSALGFMIALMLLFYDIWYIFDILRKKLIIHKERL